MYLKLGFDLAPLLSALDDSHETPIPKTIVFVRTKEEASSLWRLMRGHKFVGVHHSSLSSYERRDVEKEFRIGEKRIVIATIGFGMVFKVMH